MVNEKQISKLELPLIFVKGTLQTYTHLHLCNICQYLLLRLYSNCFILRASFHPCGRSSAKSNKNLSVQFYSNLWSSQLDKFSLIPGIRAREQKTYFSLTYLDKLKTIFIFSKDIRITRLHNMIFNRNY